MGSRQDAAGVFDVSSTSGGGTDSSNTTRIFKVEESNSETYFVVQVNYTLCISLLLWCRYLEKSVSFLCKQSVMIFLIFVAGQFA